jgi:DNA polymerase
MSTSKSGLLEQASKKHDPLRILAQKVKDFDRSPLFKLREENDYQPVLGEGNANADIMFIGEAPGKQEAQTGHPFVGRAGKFLDERLNEIGLSREAVFITNVVKDRPPKNRVPRVAEINLYKPFLLEEIEIIQPLIIATLGRISLRVLLQHYSHPSQNHPIGELHGTEICVTTSPWKMILFPLYHPAAVFYNRGLFEIVQKDFQRLFKCYLRYA